MEKTRETVPSQTPKPKPRPRERLGRIGYSVAEAARATGTTADALRRLIERHAQAEGEELVAKLTGGIVARRRKGMGRWLIVIPQELRPAG